MIDLTSGTVALSVLPERGAKVVSLRHLASGREWLEPPGGELVGPPDLTTSFDEGDMCGWDEMGPTIDACRDEWGRDLADHGELWRHPWDVVAGDESSLTTRLRDEVLALEWRRTLRLESATIHVDYEVRNDGDDECHVLWAMHPLFAHRPGLVVTLEGQSVEFVGGHLVTGAPWPAPGRGLDDLAVATCEKSFVRLSGPEAVVTLRDLEGGELEMAWDVADAAFAGVWFDTGVYSRHGVVALEPTNVPHDSLCAGVNTVAPPWTLGAGTSRRWSVRLRVRGPHSPESRERESR